MNRREALSRVSLLLGGTVIGAEFFLSGCKNSEAGNLLLDEKDISLLDEIGETIIPTTADSGGAKAAKIGEFMKITVNDCYTKNQQTTFVEGLKSFQQSVNQQYKKDFLSLSVAEREAFLTALDKEAREYTKTDDYKQKKKAFDQQQNQWVKEQEAQQNFGAVKMKEGFPPHYYTLIKQLTLLGYFTSKEGATKALRYMETPGKYDGAYPYKKGDKAWAI